MSPIEVVKKNVFEIFEFLAQIGEGSYGAVYKAKSIEDGMLVAVKVLNLGDDQETLEIQKEINILKTCDNPNIVRYRGTYAHEGKLFIAMEYCGVGSLSDLMAICEITLTEEQIAAVIKQSLRGLLYLHKSRKIHRDIKSGNILLTDRGECKLADFGVSAELNNTLAKRVTMIGTPYFMAPEVLQSSEYDAKADIWSIGITAYELATGAPPHADVHPMRAIFIIPTSPPPTLPDSFSKEFRDFLRLCLQKNPAERPSADVLLNHPFLRHVKEQPTVLALVNQCRSAIEKYRDEEALYQQGQNENAPNQGTIVRNVDGGTMVAPSASTWRYDDKTVVNAANELRRTVSNNNTGTIVKHDGKNPSQPSNYNTVVSHDMGSFADYGTVVMRNGTATIPDNSHFGSLKFRKNYDQGTVVANNHGTTVAPSKTTAAAVSKTTLALNTEHASDIVSRCTFTKDKNQLERSIHELESLYTQDLERLKDFYAEKIQTLQTLSKRK